MKIVMYGQVVATLELIAYDASGETINDECLVTDPDQIKAILDQTGLDYTTEE